jgi:hypothetical protein
VKPLRTWRTSLAQLDKIFKETNAPPDITGPIANDICDFGDISDADSQARLLRNGITTLLHAQDFAKNMKYNKIMMNVTLLAFGISWFGMVSNEHCIFNASAEQYYSGRVGFSQQ